MKQLLLERLAPLASLEQQERFIVRGTRAEYLLPHEVLDGAAHAVALALSKPHEESGLTPAEVEAIRQFDVVLRWEARDLDLDAWSNEDLVRRCPEWAEIRSAAADCLASLETRGGTKGEHVV